MEVETFQIYLQLTIINYNIFYIKNMLQILEWEQI